MTYYYVVTSVYDDDNESEYSNMVMATPMSTVILEVGDASAMGGDLVQVAIGMSNAEPVSGVQFDLEDAPKGMITSESAGLDDAEPSGF